MCKWFISWFKSEVGQRYREWVGLEQMIDLLVSTHVAEHNAGLDWRRLLFWGEGLCVSRLQPHMIRYAVMREGARSMDAREDKGGTS